MILRESYRQDLVADIKELPDDLFTNVGTSKSAVLSDDDVVERLWGLYQKSIEEYDVDPGYALRDALFEVLGIPMPHN